MSQGFDIKTKIDMRRVVGALRRAPEVMNRYLSRGVERAGMEVARAERKAAPKAFSTLTQSIRSMRESPFRAVVSPGVDYAQFVEEGTHGGTMPPVQNLLDWIKVSRISPRDPDMSEEDLAFIISRSIAKKGTPAQPFIEPTAQYMRSTVERIILNAAQAGLNEVERA